MRAYQLLITLALAGCQPAPDSKTAAAGSAASRPPAAAGAPDSVAWPVPFAPAASINCLRVVRPGTVLRTRPAADAPKFGTVASDEPLHLLARTATGWVGFDPRVAQAANVGIFRLRWVPLAALVADSACADLPLVVPPPAGCVLMAGHPVPVRAQPQATAPVLGLIPTGSYAQVTRPGGDWVQVQVPGRPAPGYVLQADMSFSGYCQ